mmetsp:Transcript_66920/g.93092  ORF Transcript_66920/g.93092 Transcript_66920/m.93092 type:complete len:260 (-) Transcript_66920:620-1399(-)
MSFSASATMRGPGLSTWPGFAGSSTSDDDLGRFRAVDRTCPSCCGHTKRSPRRNGQAQGHAGHAHHILPATLLLESMNCELLPVEEPACCIEHRRQASIRDLCRCPTPWLRNDGIRDVHEQHQALGGEVRRVCSSSMSRLLSNFHGYVCIVSLEYDTAIIELGRIRESVLQPSLELFVPASDNQHMQRTANTFHRQLFWPRHVLAATSCHDEDHLGVRRRDLCPLNADVLGILWHQEWLSDRIARKERPVVPERQRCLL